MVNTDWPTVDTSLVCARSLADRESHLMPHISARIERGRCGTQCLLLSPQARNRVLGWIHPSSDMQQVTRSWEVCDLKSFIHRRDLQGRSQRPQMPTHGNWQQVNRDDCGGLTIPLSERASRLTSIRNPLGTDGERLRGTVRGRFATG